MSLIFVFFAMIFCHIIDDFVLQGKLADFKQKDWWKQNCPNKKYSYDYIVCLILHSVEWTFMIMLPLALHAKLNCTIIYIIGFIVNATLHCIVDDIKCNKKLICLEADQICHFIQICLTFIVYILINKFGIIN